MVKATEKLDFDSRKNPLQESKATNKSTTIAPNLNAATDIVALVKAIVQESDEKRFQQWQNDRMELQVELKKLQVQINELQVELKTLKDKGNLDILKLRMMILRSFQLPDDYMEELTQDINPKYFDEVGILF